MDKKNKRSLIRSIIWVGIFGIAMAFIESAVVVYLRLHYYPNGFSFPLVLVDQKVFFTEFVREAATVVMLLCVSVMNGRNFWQKFSYFIFAFGVWDIFYYIWLKVLLHWPATLFDWDIFFLIPLPWIGPVIAPLLISMLMIISGIMILQLEHRTKQFHPRSISYITCIVGVGIILFTFMRDTNATLYQAMPQPFWYWIFSMGFILSCVSFVIAYLNSKHQ